MIAVVGSGPSGVAAAHTLWRAGFDVTVLDAGLVLEPRFAQSVEDYRHDQDADRFLATIAPDKAAAGAGQREFNDKLSFGSDFPYREADKYVVGDVEAANIRASLALGGLSNVWGSAVLPVVPRDIASWPITHDQLATHYAALDDIMDIASTADGLQSCFGGMSGRPPDFPLGRQGRDFLALLAPHGPALVAKGIHVGRARLAVGKGHSPVGVGCQSCGLCMYGCPYGSIFNSAHVIEKLRREDKVDYRGNLIVEQVTEGDHGVTVTARDLADGTPYVREFERVFLAAGPVSTTSILGRSLGWQDLPLRFHDSQLFIFPILRFDRAVGAMSEEVNRLAEIFVEIDNAAVCDRLVHLQLYGFNHLILDELYQRFGRWIGLFPALLRLLLERLFLVQGFLHSDLSGTIRLEWPGSGEGHGTMPRLVGEPNAGARGVIDRALSLLRSERGRLRALPLRSQLTVSPPGQSRHIGGSLPMRRAPGRGETDLLGRPAGLQRVHAVDATILPSIPATTITYTVMANAVRIADAVARDLERPAS